MGSIPIQKSGASAPSPSSPSPSDDLSPAQLAEMKYHAHRILVGSEAFRKAQLYSSLSSKLIEKETAWAGPLSPDQKKNYQYAIEGLGLLAFRSIQQLSDMPWGENQPYRILGHLSSSSYSWWQFHHPIRQDEIMVNEVLKINSPRIGAENAFHVDSKLGFYSRSSGLYQPPTDRIYIIDNPSREYRGYGYERAYEKLDAYRSGISSEFSSQLLLDHEKAHRHFQQQTGSATTLYFLAEQIDPSDEKNSGKKQYSCNQLLGGANELQAHAGEARRDPYNLAFYVSWALRNPKQVNPHYLPAFEGLLNYVARPRGPLKWLSVFHDVVSQSASRATKFLDAVISFLKIPWKKADEAAASRRYGYNYPLRSLLRLAAMPPAIITVPFHLAKFAIFVSNTAFNAFVHVLVLDKRVKRVYDPHKFWTVKRLAKRFIKNDERLKELQGSLGLAAFEKEFKRGGLGAKFEAQNDELASVRTDPASIRRILEPAFVALDPEARRSMAGLGYGSAESVAAAVCEAFDEMRKTSAQFTRLLKKQFGSR